MVVFIGNGWGKEMSVKLMTAAFGTELPTTQKFVFVALCDNASDEGDCYPSISTLCKKTSLSERAVQGAIKRLVEMGYMIATMRKGQSTIYRISPVSEWPELSTPPAPDAPPQEMRPAPDAPHPRTTCTPPPQEMRGTPAPRAPITINEPSIEPSGNRQKAQAPFSTDLLIRDGVPDDVARDFAELRKRLKAPISETAIKGLIREAQKAGMTLTEVLETVCANGWRGFKADWVRNRPGGRQEKTLYERNMEAGERAKRLIFGEDYAEQGL